MRLSRLDFVEYKGANYDALRFELLHNGISGRTNYK